jgi:hypothetical protein
MFFIVNRTGRGSWPQQAQKRHDRTSVKFVLQVSPQQALPKSVIR